MHKKEEKLRAIILAAGRDNMLDGMIKCLIRHPRDGRPVLQHLVDAFDGMEMTVVVGYRAIEIIQEFPGLGYVVNKDWAVTNSAYSLALALDERPCMVVSGDIFLDAATVASLAESGPDCALTSRRENRGMTALNAVTSDGCINEVYTGMLHSPEDLELLGLYKVSSPKTLSSWKRNGFDHSNLFCGQALPVGDDFPAIRPCPLAPDCMYHEINTVEDYLRLAEKCRRPIR